MLISALSWRFGFGIRLFIAVGLSRGLLTHSATGQCTGGPACADGIPSCIHQQIYLICVDDHRRCNSYVDCDDASDEMDCGLCFEDGANLTTGELHVFTTPGYPISYPTNIDCSYFVKAPSGHFIVFSILDFLTEPSSDILQIKSPSLSTKLDLSGASSPDVIYTNKNDLFLTFSSDGWTTYNGFKIEISVENSIVTKCNSVHWECFNVYLQCFHRKYLCDIGNECPSNGIDQHNCAGLPGRRTHVLELSPVNTTSITSPSYPLYYPLNVDMQWQITSSPGSLIRMVFVNFSLAINEDFLYVTSNGSRITAGTLVSFTGDNTAAKVLLSDQNEIWLRFVAGDSTNVRQGMGFVIEFTVEDGCSASEFACRDGEVTTCLDGDVQCNFLQECADASDEGPQCGFCWNPIFSIGSSKSVVLQSLFHPLQYPPYLRCFAQISVPSTYGIKLVITNFMIAKQDQFLLSNTYVDEGTFDDGLNAGDLIYFTDRVLSVLSFRTDVWLGFVTGFNNVTTGFSLEVYRFLLGDELARSCSDDAFPCSSLLPSAIVCFNSSARCDSFADCPDQKDEQGCDPTTTAPTTMDITTSTTMDIATSTTLIPTTDAITTKTSTTDALPTTMATTVAVTSEEVIPTADMTTTKVTKTSASQAQTSSVQTTTETPKPTKLTDTTELDVCSNDLVRIDLSSTYDVIWLRSPGYPNIKYDNDLLCRWEIQAKTMYRIAIGIQDVALDRGFDFLTIYDSSNTSTISLTGGSRLRQILSNDESILIEFSTDRTVVDKGFSVELSQFDGDAPACKDGAYKCDNGFCVDLSARCNGVDDCLDLSDENSCDMFNCNNVIQCGNCCVSSDQICDGFESCSDAQDEYECDTAKCPVDCECEYIDGEQLDIQCLRGWLRSMVGVSDLPITTYQLNVQIGGHTGVEMPLMTFDSLDQLMYLNISNLKFEELPNDMFESLTSLRDLVLWDSQNIEFEDEAFRGLENLDTLVIMKGDPAIERTSFLKRDQLEGAPNLRTVYVDDPKMCCDIEDIVTCVTLKATYSGSECGSLLGNKPTFRLTTFLLGIITLVGNASVIILYLFFKYYRKARMPMVQSLVLANLAAANYIMGLYLLMIGFKDVAAGDRYQDNSRRWQTSRVCRSAGFFAFLSIQASLILLLLLAIDRILSLYTPLQKRRVNYRSATGSCVFVWCFCIVSSIVFISLAGPQDSTEFGFSDVCFSLPYFVKPFGYSVSLANVTDTQIEFYLPVFNPYLTLGWDFVASFFYGLDFICLLLLVAIWIGIAYALITKYRYNMLHYSNEMKLCARLAPITLINLVCYACVVLLGMWSHNTGNIVSNDTHSWALLFILPIGCSLNPILHAVMVHLTALEIKDDDPTFDDHFTSEHGLVNAPQLNIDSGDGNIELNLHNNNVTKDKSIHENDLAQQKAASELEHQ